MDGHQSGFKLLEQGPVECGAAGHCPGTGGPEEEAVRPLHPGMNMLVVAGVQKGGMTWMASALKRDPAVVHAKRPFTRGWLPHALHWARASSTHARGCIVMCNRLPLTCAMLVTMTGKGAAPHGASAAEDTPNWEAAGRPGGRSLAGQSELRAPHSIGALAFGLAGVMRLCRYSRPSRAAGMCTPMASGTPACMLGLVAPAGPVRSTCRCVAAAIIAMGIGRCGEAPGYRYGIMRRRMKHGAAASAGAYEEAGLHPPLPHQRSC